LSFDSIDQAKICFFAHVSVLRCGCFVGNDTRPYAISEFLAELTNGKVIFWKNRSDSDGIFSDF
jgi:hypothetical protein